MRQMLCTHLAHQLPQSGCEGSVAASGHVTTVAPQSLQGPLQLRHVMPIRRGAGILRPVDKGCAFGKHPEVVLQGHTGRDETDKMWQQNSAAPHLLPPPTEHYCPVHFPFPFAWTRLPCTVPLVLQSAPAPQVLLLPPSPTQQQDSTVTDPATAIIAQLLRSTCDAGLITRC